MSSAGKPELIVQAVGITLSVALSEFVNLVYRSTMIPRIMRTSTGDPPFSIIFMVLICYFNDTFLPFNTHNDFYGVLRSTLALSSVVILLEGHRNVRYTDDVIRLMPVFIYLITLTFSMALGPYIGDLILRIIS